VSVERPVVEVRDLGPDEQAAFAAALARGMRDNPMTVAVFGEDPDRRHRRLEWVFSTLFRVMTDQVPLVAIDDGIVVGGTGVALPGTCQPTTAQRLRFLPGTLALGPATAGRMVRWLGAWGAKDLGEPHAHLGPLAVDAHLQGRGIGTQILQQHCRRLDEHQLVGYLETDKEVNVRLYQRHGYQVIGEGPVLGVRCWYMRRPA
jgi:ribosomal protein S18 acetylase RimI-like enzyme